MLELCHMCAFLRQVCDLKDVAGKSFPALLPPAPFLLPLTSLKVPVVRECNRKKLLEITFLC